MRKTTPFFKASVWILLTLEMAQAQDSAIYDAAKNVWFLHYQDTETTQWVRKTYVQQNAISPVIQSTVTGHPQSPLVYRYRITNRQEARQLVDTFRIWGLPLIYKIPNMPTVTASAFSDPETEDKQQWAQLHIKRNFEKNTITAPWGWTAALRVDEQAGQTSLVWTPGLKDSDPDGIAPGRSQEGFMVVRPELPGLARAKLTGSTEEPWGLDHLPDTPFWNKKIQEIQSRDYVLVPVLAPVISLASPYKSAEHARSLQNHIQVWLKYGHINVDILNRLNRHFDVLIPALNIGNKKMALAAIDALLKECRQDHPDLSDAKIPKDDAHHDGEPIPRNMPSLSPAQSTAMDRIAARALIFNLRYVRSTLEAR